MSFVALLCAFSLFSCASPGKRTGIGAGAGAVGGAVLGGVIGGWKGAAIGAGVGVAAGAAVGNYLDKQKRELDQVVETEKQRDGLLVKMKSDLLFDTDQATLKPAAVEQLNQLGDIFAKYKEDRIKIGGFTDSTGTTEHNLKLSQSRADAVRAVLATRGVRAEQMGTFAFGEQDPIAPNTTADGRMKNRRVELKIDVPPENAEAVKKAE